MVVYGSSATHLVTIQPQGAICPNCQEKDTTSISVFSDHAHIFWIPIFPIGKKGASECSSCKHTMDVKQMPEEYKREYNFIKGETKTPIWKFSGLVLIAGLITLGVFQSGKSKEERAAFVASPLIGDLYKTKADGMYSCMRISDITSDSLFVSPNMYEVNKSSGVKDLDIEENYMGFSYGIHRDEITRMFNSDEIYDIDRK